MLISSGVFAGLAWRVPVVCSTQSSSSEQHTNSLIAKAPLLCHYDSDHHHCCHLLLRHGHRPGCLYSPHPRP
jgi:hypothetical protein